MPSKAKSMSAIKAAETVIETIMQMVADGRPMMQRVIPDDKVIYWEHYPDKDARDAKTLSRWYYHVHADGDRDAEEHGHFHLFLHQTQLTDPDGAWSEPSNKSEKRANVLHVAALSIDRSGIPRKWMVTNRWITDEWLYPADKIIPRLDDFNVDNTPQDKTVNRFLTAMVALYRGEIEQLILKRDARFAEMGASKENREPFQKGNDVLAELPIDLDEKLEELGLA